MRPFLLFFEQAQRYYANNPGQRKGQAYMECLRKFFPEAHHNITGTECDPFYDDTKIPAFLKAADQEISK